MKAMISGEWGNNATSRNNTILLTLGMVEMWG